MRSERKAFLREENRQNSRIGENPGGKIHSEIGIGEGKRIACGSIAQIESAKRLSVQRAREGTEE